MRLAGRTPVVLALTFISWSAACYQTPTRRALVPLYVQKDLYAFSSDLDFEPLPRQQFGTALRRMRWRQR